jgi:shikimate dehydrogenase
VKLFGIIGNPVNHSKSPAIMNAAFAALNIDAHYLKIASNSVDEAVVILKNLGFSGANVTAPYKNSIIPYIDEFDEAAKSIGSVNTIILKNNNVKGYNTDYLGVINSIKGKKVELENKNVLLIGAGGAAKAAVFGLVHNNSMVTIINRTLSKAQNIAKQFNIQYKNWDEINNAISKADIIINTIPSGTYIFDIENFNSEQIIFDANYHHSPFKEIAEIKNITFIDGKEWLLNQAYPSFEIFSGKKAPKNRIVKGIKVSEKRKNISLIGFMGSGKTSIGKELSKKLNYQFVDIDKEIERREGISIKEIFELKGEAYFRKLERNVLQEVLKKESQVISCGGGIIMDEINRDNLKRNSSAVWLYADIVKSIERLKNNKRPLLNVENKEEKAVNLFNERKLYYAATCDIIFDSTKFNKARLTQKIYEEISISI